MIRPTSIPRLETPRLVLRALEPGDAPAIFAILADPETVRYWSTPPMQSVAEAEALIARDAQYIAEGSGQRWALCPREGGDTIGTISLFRFDEQSDRAEIGYVLARETWGKGFMSEALSAVIDYAFDTLHLRRLEADTDPRNEGSVKLLARMGFAREGLLRERWVVAGEISDTLFSGLLAREWRARRTAR